MTKINCDYTDEVVCPYCGHEQSDSWEYEEYHNPIECGECGKEFKFSRQVEVTYCTWKMEEE